MNSICVFCGANVGQRPIYVDVARSLGTMLAHRNIILVYGGGRVGLMGALAEAALAAGGRVIGVIPQLLVDQEVAHTGLTELQVVSSMAERKARMGELADAFLTLPGGIGTMDELFEAWSWTQLGLQSKPCGLLNQDGYYDALITFIDKAVAEGFLRPRHRAALLVDSDIHQLLQRLADY